jgi:hypothetical protein
VAEKTRDDAARYVTEAIEANGKDVASAKEFDLEAIIDELREIVGDWDFDKAEEDTFWSVVQKHDSSREAE